MSKRDVYKRQVLYRGQISLAEPFERDTDYILGGDLN